MRDLVLFDMDGTLTPARKPISLTMVRYINKLCKYADVGIVTGSGYDYIMEQCSLIWDSISSDPSLIDLLPCNGTQRYVWVNNAWSLVSTVDMRDELGETYQKLIRQLLYEQYVLCSNDLTGADISGTFFQYRGSVLNWCLIGRDSTDESRQSFRDLDQSLNIRERLRSRVIGSFPAIGVSGVSLSLGGHTSIDVYPDKWDKTYALTHYSKSRPNSSIWFVGDNCVGSGNDRPLYDALSPQGTAYMTTGPEYTQQIIDLIIDQLIKRQEK